jgi:membrane-associated PAP2 superfamily phosphatase
VSGPPGAARPPRRDLVLALAALVLLLAWDASGADLWVARRWGAPAGFPWRDAWLTRGLLHEGGRLLAGAVLIALGVDALRRPAAGPSRRARAGWLGVVVVSLLSVPLLKRVSATSCPWDLVEFGGHAQWVSHWAFGVLDGGPGHCFPSGHAVAAFAFFGVYFLWRDHDRARARWALAGVWVAGLLLGGAQVVRGAHYPSHVFWSAWVCWGIAAGASAWQGWRVRRAAAVDAQVRGVETSGFKSPA